MSGERQATYERKTRETQVSVSLNLDGASKSDIRTGVGFFDHMLELLAFHSRFDLEVVAHGDLAVDDHHTVEDVGISLGTAFRLALGSEGTDRYGDLNCVMDEALVLTAVDLSGRGMARLDLPFVREKLGELSTECIGEFLSAFARHAGIGLHVRKLAGTNDHHVAEAAFKGLGVALRQATRRSDRPGVHSSKGVID